MVTRLFNRHLAVYRTSEEIDGGGGRDTTRVHTHTIRGRASNPRPTERTVAASQDAESDWDVYVAPSADVQRGDELRDEYTTYWVNAVVRPSKPVYAKAECYAYQREGRANGT